MKALLLIILLLIHSPSAFGWGKWGHATVGQTAALLLAKERRVEWLHNHTYDLGYYNIVPDSVWKGLPGKYAIEFPQHFVDIEIFNRTKTSKQLAEDRATFEKQNKKIPLKAGRAYWRIAEIYKKLQKITKKLKDHDPGEKKTHHSLQGEWLTLAGVLGHYVADLAQPLHCSENYDGQLTNQKGLHAFFETKLVQRLQPDLQSKVYNRSKELFKKLTPDLKKLSIFELSQKLCEDSFTHLKSLLTKDKKTGRKKLNKAREIHEPMIIDRLATGSVYLAEMWGRQVGWGYNGDKFYFFNHKPAYIQPLQVKKEK